MASRAVVLASYEYGLPGARVRGPGRSFSPAPKCRWCLVCFAVRPTASSRLLLTFRKRKVTMADDIDKLIGWARSQGWRVEIDNNGYRRFFTPDGVYVVRYPATPSNPRRRLRDVVTAVRAHGLEWPRPSKSALRSRRRKEQ